MRALFCSFSNPGLLFPLIGLANELRARGHEIAFVAGQGASHWLSSIGLTRIPRGTKDGVSYQVNVWPEPLYVAMDVKHLEYGIRLFRPDLLVTHILCLAPLICSDRLKIPVAVMGLMSYLWPLPPGSRPTVSPQITATRDWRLKDMGEHYNRCRAAFGLGAVKATPADNPFLGDVFMLRTLRQLEPDVDSLPEQVHLIGAAQWEAPLCESVRREQPAWEAISTLLSSNRPRVYVQAGRTFGESGFWGTLVKALGDTPFGVVASVGRADGELGALPVNFAVCQHAPQTLVIPHCTAVVSGGYTTPTLGAMTLGRPTIVFPTGGETRDNAARIERSKCGVALTTNSSPERVRSVIESIYDDCEL